MNRLATLALLLIMTVAAAGCGGDGGGDTDEDDPLSPATPAPTTAPVATTTPGPTIPRTNLTLRISDLRLSNSEESDNGVRLLLPTGVANASVTLTGVPSPNRVINVCQARELDRRQEAATCRTPANGEAVSLTLGSAASGVEIVQLGTSAAGPEGNATTLSEVTISYSASSREVNVRLPQIAGAQAGARLTFAMTPASADGSYRAALTWTTIPVFGGSTGIGQLELVQGGNVSNQAQSSGEVRMNGNVSPPGDAAIRVQNVGESALVTARLSLLLP